MTSSVIAKGQVVLGPCWARGDTQEGAKVLAGAHSLISGLIMLLGVLGAKCQRHSLWQVPFVTRATAKDRGWLQGAIEAVAQASWVCKDTGQSVG